MKLVLLLFFIPTIIFSQKKTPVIDITDLYHMHQDVGDNIDLINAYSLSEIDLKAIILDCSEGFRGVKGKVGADYTDPEGPREAGFIPVLQMNYIFDKNIPCAVGPFNQMKSPDDKMLGISTFQESGIDLILTTLEKSDEKITIVSFGSARPLAVAYNRNPELFIKKVSCIHLSAGGGYPEHPEWNVGLDPNAIICLLNSTLPIAIYPCAQNKNTPSPKNYFETAFALDMYNTYYEIHSMNFVNHLSLPLKRYIAFAFGKEKRNDFLAAMEKEDKNYDSILNKIYSKKHHVWETAIWMQVAHRKTIYSNAGWRFIEEEKVKAGDSILIEKLLPCKVITTSNGYFTFEITSKPTNFKIYYREKPLLYQTAMNEAFPEYLKSIKIQTK